MTMLKTNNGNGNDNSNATTAGRGQFEITLPTTTSAAYINQSSTPAMEAGLAEHVWNVEDLIALLPQPEAKKRDPYNKRDAA